MCLCHGMKVNEIAKITVAIIRMLKDRYHTYLTKVQNNKKDNKSRKYYTMIARHASIYQIIIIFVILQS